MGEFSALVKAILELNVPSTIYFSKMEYKADAIDQYFYYVIGHYLSHNDNMDAMIGKDKTEHFETILYAWQRLLREPLTTLPNAQITCFSDIDVFVESFRISTQPLSEEQKIELLYRFPWHLKILMMASPDRFLNIVWIVNMIESESIDTLRFPRVGYWEIGNLDQEAMDIIADDIKENHIELLNDSLTKALPIAFQFAAILSQQIELGKLNRSALDQLIGDDKIKSHAAAIIAYMFNKLIKRKELADFDEYVLATTFYLCFWHVMLRKTDHSWLVQNQPFHLMKEDKWIEPTNNKK